MKYLKRKERRVIYRVLEPVTYIPFSSLPPQGSATVFRLEDSSLPFARRGIRGGGSGGRIGAMSNAGEEKKTECKRGGVAVGKRSVKPKCD